MTQKVVNMLETVDPYQFQPIKGTKYVGSSSEDEGSMSDNGDLITDTNTKRKGNTDW